MQSYPKATDEMDDQSVRTTSDSSLCQLYVTCATKQPVLVLYSIGCMMLCVPIAEDENALTNKNAVRIFLAIKIRRHVSLYLGVRSYKTCLCQLHDGGTSPWSSRQSWRCTFFWKSKTHEERIFKKLQYKKSGDRAGIGLLVYSEVNRIYALDILRYSTPACV